MSLKIGKKGLRSLPFLIGVGLFFVGALLFAVWPDLYQKTMTEKKDRSVSFVVDWMDLQVSATKENKPIRDLLDQIRAIPVHVLSVPTSLSKRHEKWIREKGLTLLWREQADPLIYPKASLRRLKRGDGLLSLGGGGVGVSSIPG